MLRRNYLPLLPHSSLVGLVDVVAVVAQESRKRSVQVPAHLLPALSFIAVDSGAALKEIIDAIKGGAFTVNDAIVIVDAADSYVNEEAFAKVKRSLVFAFHYDNFSVLR